jgi:hypothetical protein
MCATLTLSLYVRIPLCYALNETIPYLSALTGSGKLFHTQKQKDIQGGTAEAKMPKVLGRVGKESEPK